jgi:hypothetical protein
MVVGYPVTTATNTQWGVPTLEGTATPVSSAGMSNSTTTNTAPVTSASSISTGATATPATTSLDSPVSQTQPTVTTNDDTPTSDEPGFAMPPPFSPEEKSRSSSFWRSRGIVLTVIIVLVVLLVGVTFEAGLLDNGAASSPAVNSASTPLSGQQLYMAYETNLAQADAQYNNKTVYIQDRLDFGVAVDPTGAYFSTINSGSIILVWGYQSQVSQLSQGETVLAKCQVVGPQPSAGGGYFLYLENCDLISTPSGTSTTSSVSVPAQNL